MAGFRLCTMSSGLNSSLSCDCHAVPLHLLPIVPFVLVDSPLTVAKVPMGSSRLTIYQLSNSC